jgi:hypothetical protein
MMHLSTHTRPADRATIVNPDVPKFKIANRLKGAPEENVPIQMKRISTREVQDRNGWR